MAKKLGNVVKKFLSVKSKIKAKSREIEELKSEAFKMELELIISMETEKLSRFDVESLGSVTLKTPTIGVVKEWDKFYKFIKKNNAFELLQKRIGQTAFGEYLEANKKVPGVETMVKKSLTVGWKKGI